MFPRLVYRQIEIPMILLFVWRLLMRVRIKSVVFGYYKAHSMWRLNCFISLKSKCNFDGINLKCSMIIVFHLS